MDFRSFAEVSLDALALVRHGRIAFVNAAARRRLGGGDAAKWEGRDPSTLAWPRSLTERWQVAPDLECVRLRPEQPGDSAADLWGPLFQVMFQRSPDPMYVIDPEALQYIDVNPAALEAHGLTREVMFTRHRPGTWGTTTGEDALRQIYRDLIAAWPQSVRQIRPSARRGSEFMTEYTRQAVRWASAG